MQQWTTLVPLYFFVFATGAAGLIYEVAWQKYLSRLFGSDSIATAVILATFLGGLSLGYYLCGKLTTRVRNHFKAYAFLEGFIALWCLSFPTIFSFVDSFTRSWSFAPPVLIIVQAFACSVFLMGLPTVCMGGTIPFLTRGVSRNVAEATGVHARVYGINTAGAFLGTLLAGFFLIPAFGLPLTVMATAFLNVGAFLFFYLLSLKKGGAARSTAGTEEPETQDRNEEPTAAPKERAGSKKFPALVLYAVAFLSGFYVMTLENVLIRLADLSLGSSSYTFSMIVSVFVLSIAVGSYAVSRLGELPRRALFVNQLTITLLLFLIYLSLDTWPYWSHVVRIAFQSNEIGFWAYYGCLFLVLMIVLVLPVSLMGATVPIAFHELKEDLARVGRDSGNLFSWNTIGNLTGSLLGGIVFFYFVDIPAVFAAAVLIAAMSTCLSAMPLRRRYLAAAASAAALAVLLLLFTPWYNVRNFTLGTFRTRTATPCSLSGPRTFFDTFSGKLNLKFYKDGPANSVAVVASAKSPPFKEVPLSIVVNGKSDSSTIVDIYTLKLLAHIPALLAPSREKVLVIGLGTGTTAGEVSLYPDVKRIDIAEISPTVVEALPYFRTATHDIHEDSRVRIHIADAFRILRGSDSMWDIIISEPSNPWVSGVDQLYTQEFYKLARQHMTGEGMILQWIHTYDSSEAMVGMIANTIVREFPHTSVFMASEDDIFFVASVKPLTGENVERAEKILAGNPHVLASLDKINIKSVDEILIRQIWSPSYIRNSFSGFGIQTMDNPRLHYMAGRQFFKGSGLTDRFLLGPDTAYVGDEFLLAKKYADWRDHDFSNDEYMRLFKSTRNVMTGLFLPAARALKMKAFLKNPGVFTLSESDEKSVRKELIPLITGSSEAQEDWAAAGLAGASFRKKAQAMLGHINALRNWVAPYPIDGFKGLLGRCMKEAAAAQDRNWCGLQLALVLLKERADEKLIQQVLSGAVKGNDGKLILKDEDAWLLDSISMRMTGNP